MPTKVTMDTKSPTNLSLKLIIFIVVITMLMSTCYSMSRNWHCGRPVETMHEVCQGCYAGHVRPRNTRSVDGVQAFISRRDANMFTKGMSPDVKRAIDGGLIEECCYSQCSLTHMITYCCAEVQNEFQVFINILGNTDESSENDGDDGEESSSVHED
ncbi:uncharacterized protein LOC102807437 isoform X2 [Saccoglossus kowalevskii]|uniref:Bombyxin-related peptide B-like n=1 Tax=Saccoglossus kowalevskii TaxID=10224 RepID=A0ABM0M555_SACKO|nr:PREDICTED: bombyxin-related peptide B-like [Saccoglossus kowalevskii]